MSEYIVVYEGYEDEIRLKAKYEVCDTCHGTGTTVNPSIDHYGLSREDFDEDPDFEENYFSGVYNVPCRTCGGQRVELVPDEDNNDPETLKRYDEYLRDRYAMAREQYNEMRAEGQEVFMSDFGY